MAKFNEPGRGRKQCKSCKAYVGVRTAVCECGSAFPKAEAPPAPPPRAKVTEPAATAEPVVAPVRRRARIWAAAGRCPVPYEGDVEKWAQKLQDLGAEHGVEYTVTALGLWLKEYVADLTEWQKIISRLGTDAE